ncbi:MAG TPA: ChaN family lipoprotein [Flavobacteriales bacterium]|nr:ChaN family lipoprotein [Flavobacteriales bacterium]
MRLTPTLFAAALFLWGTSATYAQELPAYALFNAKGKPMKYKAMLKQVKGADIILFGEQHNSAIAHWLELEATRELAVAGPLVLGAEMIERDDQPTLDRYLRGEIDQAAFDTLARLWGNHKSDYKPLVDLAKDRGLPFVAANVPRRYARAVARGGFEALDTVPEAERAWMAPLPIAFDPELPRYQHMLTMMGEHGTVDVVKAQALKDATMAQSIADHFRPGARFIHFNGSYHSDFHEGIGWYLQRLRPDLKRVTIATVTQAQLRRLDAEHLGRADIIIVVDEDIPGTY